MFALPMQHIVILCDIGTISYRVEANHHRAALLYALVAEWPITGLLGASAKGYRQSADKSANFPPAKSNFPTIITLFRFFWNGLIKSPEVDDDIDGIFQNCQA